MYYNQIAGNLGEAEAIKFLIANDYKIMKKNFRCNFGEIDIIAKDTKKNEIVFIEVKTRSNMKYGSPADGINLYKEKHIVKSSEFFVHINRSRK